MKDNKKISLFILVLLCTSLYSATRFAQAQERFSAIFVAHGSTNSAHNQKVINLKNNVRSAPTPNPSLSGLEVAFLGNNNQGKMDDALRNIHLGGISHILLIPLSPCSYIRHEDIKTRANDKANALGMNALQFKLAPAMDDHPVAAEILKEHAKNLSTNPKNERLLLFAYGPVDELENIAWVRRLEQMGNAIGTELGVQEVVCATVRNHSADLIAEQSIIDLRRKARALKEKGRVIVVPYVFEDGPYKELQSYLSGIIDNSKPAEGAIAEVGFVSNPKIKDWVNEVISKGMNQPQVRPVNKHGSTQKGPKENF